MTEPVFHESHARIGHEPGRAPERLVIVAVVLLLLLVVKPWGATPETATARRPAPSLPPTPEVLRYNELPCSGLMWLVEADTRWAGEIVRSWILTEAVDATGPTDPSIKFAVVAAQQVLAIGYCPAYRDDTRPHDRLTIYRLEPTVGPVIITPVHVPREAEAAANVLFAPMSRPGPSGQAPGVASWGPGRYVIQIEGPNGYERWLGVEVRIISFGTPAPESPSEP